MTIDLTSFGSRPTSPKPSNTEPQHDVREQDDTTDPTMDEIKKIEKSQTPVYRKFHWQIDKFSHSKEDFLYKAPDEE